MKKYILGILCLFIYSASIYSQNKTVTVSGTISDEKGEPLIGVSITVKNMPGLGVITDPDGKYSIKTQTFQYLVYSYIGFEIQEHLIKDEDIVLDIIMKESKETVLDEITITGLGPQKKVTQTGAITAVDVQTLKTPATSVANALAGNVAGVMAMQRSGQPGANTSEFWIRGISTFGGGSSALVLVDGFERSMDELNIEDIESFTVLKDASTTAIYGSRGANGVILITTKRGNAGKVVVDAKAEYTYTTRTFTPEFVDGMTYATMMNEALTTRNRRPAYSADELSILRDGLDPDIYPNVDWKDLLLKDGAPSFRGNVNIQGGGTTARYFLSGSYLNEGGMYHVDKTMKDYDTNANYERYNYRLNLDMNPTSSTLIKVGIGGSLEKTNHAGANSDYIWNSIFGYNPITMPIFYSNGYVPMITKLNDDNLWEGQYNPWTVATQTGYSEVWKNKIQTNITLEQKLDFITEGLQFNFRFGYDTYNENYIQRRKNPEMWRVERLRDSNGNLVFNRMVIERLMYQYSSAKGERKEFFESDLIYRRTFAKAHSVGVIFKYTQDQYINTSNIENDIIEGINRRHQNLAGGLSYDYKNRYLVNFNFGYSGSENFAKGHQYGFFPAASVAWNIAEESFIKNNVEWLEMLKLRYSYGETGNDNLKDRYGNDIRFPYLATIGNYGFLTYGSNRQNTYYNWGDLGSTYQFNGLTYSKISSNNVSWEIAKKHDVGLDLYLDGDKFGLTIDYFNEKREGIYMPRDFLPNTVGLQYYNDSSIPYANIGSTSNKGFDGNFSFNSKVDRVNVQMRGNFTYSKNEITGADELYNRYPYLNRTGYRVDQAKGLIAEGLFKDYEDIRNSPRQDFGEVMPGDIKYRDINGDGIINNNDVVPIGATTRPNLIYGFGISANWNGFDINVHFQGAGKSNFFIDGFTVYPFESGEWGNILKDVQESSRWILGENEDINAKYPRLSYGGNNNNYRPSTYWLRDGSYIRLKTLEVGYTIPKNIVNRVYLNNVRLHLIGQNLLTFSNFKLWDPEMGSSNGQKYPLGKTITVGLSVKI